MWRLRRPDYDLPEAGAINAIYASYHRKLDMRHMATDPAVFLRHTDDGRLDGIAAVQFDVSLITGPIKFVADEHCESATFPSKGHTLIGA